ncbi:tachykinins isoform X2 [Drosophila tropicalis]|uniref:tachykinins isoform X2 n=1 Tax=Drosophila tropicalis TaxID=46794 RepID=UPI0035ABBC3D
MLQHLGSNGMLLSLLLLTMANAAISEGENSLSSTATSLQQEPRKLVKRAPAAGFIGMRGKKELETDSETDGERAVSNDNWLGPDPLDYAEDSDDYYENGRRLKKAPTAFVGMRGKKYTPSSNRLSNLLRQIEEQRLRENVLQELFDRLADQNTVGDAEIPNKRAPTGFTGMRGKRPAEDDDDAIELFEKRAPVNAFVGVRGKKDVSHQNYKRAAPLSEAYDVRGKKHRFFDFNNKFVAVRGKKNNLDLEDGQAQYLVHPWSYLLSEKRAPNGFVGMRGKRPVLALE